MTKLIDLKAECKEGGKEEVQIDETTPVQVRHTCDISRLIVNLPIFLSLLRRPDIVRKHAHAIYRDF